jgi:uncharacterized protein DUF3995
MIRGLGFLVAAIFLSLALLHVYWAAGGVWGRGIAVPTVAPTGGGGGARLFNPTRTGTLAVAAGLLLAALVVLGRLGIQTAPVPGWVFALGSWFIALAFLARAIGEFRYVGLFKRVWGTDFANWDTWLFTPLCLFIAVAAGVISYFAPRR